MLKRLCLLLFALIARTLIFSQAIETKMEYQKTQQPVAQISLPCNEDVAEDALHDYMAKRGAKASGFKEFTVYRSFKLDSSDTEPSDLYFKIEKKSHKEKDVTLLTLLPAKKGEELLTRTVTEHTQLDQARSFLDKLAPFIEAHHITVQIANQEDVLRKSQKKMSDLMDDQADLEKKIRRIQSDMDQNKNDQAKEDQEIKLYANADFDTRQKAQKKMNHLIDTKSDLDKKLRKTQAELDQNKSDQLKQQQQVQNEQQVLAAIKAKKVG